MQCHSWVGKAYSEKPSQTYGNMVLGVTAEANPCQSHQLTLACRTAPCVCVCVRASVCLSVLSTPKPQWVFCQGCMLCLPNGLWSSGVQPHTERDRARAREGGSSASILDANQICSSVGTLKHFIKSKVPTGRSYSDTLH